MALVSQGSAVRWDGAAVIEAGSSVTPHRCLSAVTTHGA